MSTIKHVLGFAVVCCALGVFTGCESSGGGSSSSSVGVYYGVGFGSPYYYGDYDQDVDVDINRPDRPGNPDRPLRPEQPIERPPDVSSRSTAAYQRSATPSIPSTPRPMPRSGGGGGRR